MILMAAGIPSYNFPIPKGSFFDLVFHQTNFSLQILGLLNPPLSLNLIGLIIIILIAFAANAVTERLTSSKAGGLFTAVLITLIGSYLFAAFVRFPFDFQLEGVRIIAALLGAIIIAVFYTLIRKPGASKKELMTGAGVGQWSITRQRLEWWESTSPLGLVARSRQ